MAGLVRYTGYRLFKPPGGTISTATNGLTINFDYPSQFIGTLSVFRELVEPEYWFVQRALDENSVFFDVGAAIGGYSVCVAALTGCTVHAFEPLPENIRTLTKNLAANRIESKVKLNQAALSGSEGYGFIQNDSGQDLFGGHLTMVSSERTENAVKVMTLDSYCARCKIERIDIIKIDVEGHEQEVMEGAKTMIANERIDVLILETDHRLSGFYNSLRNLDFEFYYFDDAHNALKRVFPLTEQNIIQLEPTAFSSNIILLHNRCLERYRSRFQVIL